MTTLRSGRLACLTGAAAGVSLAFAAACASAATIGGFGVRPAHPDPNVPATRAYFIVQARRGGVQQETVVVTNDSAKPLALAVDPVDGLTGVTSGVVYENRGMPVSGTGAWVTPAVKRVTVPARSSINVGFRVKVPNDAQPGDHVGGIAFQALKPRKSRGNFSVTVVERTVVGIEFEVPGPASKAIRLHSLALAPLPGTTVPAAIVTLEDVGRKLCHPQLTVAIKGQGATRKATQTLGTILPGDKIAYPFRWPGRLSQGRYDVTGTATRCGPQAVMHATATYSLAGDNSNYPSTNVGPTAPLAHNGWAWWLYVLVGLGALGAIALVVRYTPRRATQVTDRPPH